jgi:hypothetical protein
MEYIFPVYWRDTDEQTVISKIWDSHNGADEYYFGMLHRVNR